MSLPGTLKSLYSSYRNQTSTTLFETTGKDTCAGLIKSLAIEGQNQNARGNQQNTVSLWKGRTFTEKDECKDCDEHKT